jgi:membrane-bound lytic murein transglycosylase D
MHVKKNHSLALVSNKQAGTKQAFAMNLFCIILLCSAIFCSHRALAETNASGVEIEIVNEPVVTEFTNDPVQNLIVDIDAKDISQEDLWARIKSGYAMPDVASQYTSNHEEWYAARPNYVKRMVERSQRYLFHIVEEVQKRGMPTEIALLPMIESAFNPQAYSRSRASGIWQFVM